MTVMRRKYAKAFREEAVRLVTEGGCRVSEAAGNPGIRAGRLSRRKSGPEAPAGTGRGAPEDRREIRRLREKLRQVSMEREILKKAAAFSAQESNGGTDSSGGR